jgi:uncharacterized protein DUF6894
MLLTQRIFFDLTDGLTTLCDEVGVEVRDLDEALQQARLAVAELLSSGELGSNANWRMIVRDGNRTVLTTLCIE